MKTQLLMVKIVELSCHGVYNGLRSEKKEISKTKIKEGGGGITRERNAVLMHTPVIQLLDSGACKHTLSTCQLLPYSLFMLSLPLDPLYGGIPPKNCSCYN